MSIMWHHHCSSIYVIIILFLVLWSRPIVRADTELCLFHPYVTSIAVSLNQTVNSNKQNQTEMNIRLRLNYYGDVDIKNAVRTNTTLNLGGRVESFNGRSDIWFAADSNPLYRVERPIINDKKEYYNFSKADYLTTLDAHYKDLKLSTASKPASEVIKPCSRAFIYDTDYFVPSGRDTLVHVIYHKHERCYAKKTKTDLTNVARNSYNDYKPDKNKKYRFSNVIAATYYSPYVFEVLSSGLFAIHEYDETSKPKDDNPLGGYPLEKSVYILGSMPSSLQKSYQKHYIANSEFCQKEADKIPKFSKQFIDLELDGPPPRTLTKFNDKTYAVVPSNQALQDQHKYVLWEYDGSHKRYSRKKHRRVDIMVSGICTIEAWALLQIDETHSRSQMFIYCEDSFLTMYYSHKSIQLIDFDKELTATSNHSSYVSPDDITYWTTCKKIVSLYGFLYTMHEYDDDIIKTPSKWFKLDEKQFDFPIEAMHSEGDQFWFLMKQNTILMMQADSSDCKSNQLNLKKISYTKLANIFNPTTKLFLDEKRYFNGTGWDPEWPPSEEDSDGISLWLYVAVGVGLAAIAVIIVCYHNLSSGSGGDKPRTAKQKSKSPYHASTPVKTVRSKNITDIGPLFSDHQSKVKTIPSSNESKKSPDVKKSKKSLSPKSPGKSAPAKSPGKKSKPKGPKSAKSVKSLKK